MMKKHVNQILWLLSGALLGTVASPLTLPFLEKISGKGAETAGYRVPELKIDLSSKKGTSEVLVWKSVIPPTKDNGTGLSMHRHNYSRMLIPLTDGTLQRRDADGTTTDYVLTPGKPVPLPEDTPNGFHTDENFGKKPIEVMVVQFNQTSPVMFDKLTEDDLKTAVSKPKQ